MKATKNALRQRLGRKAVLRVWLYFLGTAINALGTALLTMNALGSDAMNTLFSAVAVKLGVFSGDIYTVFNAAMLITGFYFARRYMGIGSVLMIFCQGFFINGWQRVLLQFPWIFAALGWKATVAVISHFCKAFGTAVMISVCLGTAGFEACLFALADRIKIEYKYLKMGSEIVFFVAALFLDGVYGIMTIVEVLLFGHSMSFFVVMLNRTLWKRWGIVDERNELSRNKRNGRLRKHKVLISIGHDGE